MGLFSVIVAAIIGVGVLGLTRTATPVTAGDGEPVDLCAGCPDTFTSSPHVSPDPFTAQCILDGCTTELQEEVGPTRPIIRLATINELFEAWEAGQIINPGGQIQLPDGSFVTVPDSIPPELQVPASETPTTGTWSASDISAINGKVRFIAPDTVDIYMNWSASREGNALFIAQLQSPDGTQVNPIFKGPQFWGATGEVRMGSNINIRTGSAQILQVGVWTLEVQIWTDFATKGGIALASNRILFRVVSIP